MTPQKNDTPSDLLVGMKAIRQHLHNISEVTVLKWHRELGLPIRKSDKNGTAGVWLGSRKKMNEWATEYVSGGVV